MKNRKFKYQVVRFLIFALLLVSQNIFPQSAESFHKFPVTNQGIYKISQEQAFSIGFDNLDDVGIFGYPGMLPQKIDTIDLEYHVIPSQILENEVYFYLEGPDRIRVNNGEIHYERHLYADTIFYLIGKKKVASQIPIIESQAHLPATPLGHIFQFQVKKWETNNILSSGRTWYSEPIFRNQSLDFSFQNPGDAEREYWLEMKLMGQSLSESNFDVLANGKALETVTIPSIPNSRYGIKGREDLIKIPFNKDSDSEINIRLSYQTGDVNGAGYLDYAVLATPFKALNISRGLYYTWKETSFIAEQQGNQKVWNVSNPHQVQELRGNHSLAIGEQIVIFEPSDGTNISQLEKVDMDARLGIKSSLIIITTELFTTQANRLAAHKRSKGIDTKVINLNAIYDAFGYGTKDVTAIRNFLAFHFQKTRQLKNVLFFGKGTFDYKGKIGGRPNLIPTYSSRNSLNPLTTYSSDDYFGFLNMGQGEWSESASGDELLQIGVGRIPAVNAREAAEMVDKIIAYEIGINQSGDWKRKIAFFADDGDNNIHLNDAESHATFINKNHPEFQIHKLYLDRFEQIRTATNQFSPEAKTALKQTVENGILILNYIGHGNETTLTAERVFSVNDLNDWPENEFLPLMVTATCEFGRHDSPLIRSGAEEMLFAYKKGAIGMLTTGRPVFSSINFALNKAFIEAVFEQENGEYLDLGAIFRKTKNNSLNGAFNRNFSLLGDPSLKLALPDLKTQIEDIFDINLEISTDTLKAKQAIQIIGRIVDPVTKAFIPGANGDFELMITDKPVNVETLGDESESKTFPEEDGVLFQGTGKVKGGEFRSEVFVPQNLDYNFEIGKIRVFAKLNQPNQEAMGAQNIVIGGSSNSIINDMEGPKIQLILGDNLENQLIHKSSKIPIVILLEDESGINVSPNNIGQDISIRINNNPPVFLNHLFFALDGTYKKGMIDTLLEDLEEGKNVLTVEAWDNVGNSSIATKEITVKGSLEIHILEHITYPNPTTDKSTFRISHNRPQENIFVALRVFTIMGKEIYNTQKRYVKADPVLEDIEWNFLFHKTKNPAKAVYLYEIELSSELDGTSDRKRGKIIIK